jgi:hypothetical protein
MSTTKTKALLACGAVGGPAFVIVFLIEGATRIDYSPLRQPVSSLSIGDSGWIQIANFITTGCLLLAFAMGLRRALRPSRDSTWGSLLVGFLAIGLIGAGVFIADPLNGYPPGTAVLPTERTVHGRLHDLFGLPVFLGLPIACLVFSRVFVRLGKRGWGIYSACSGFLMFVAFVLSGMGFSQNPSLVNVAGLFQRVSITVGWSWMTLLAVYLLRGRGSARSLGPSGCE